ncbi:uncharacterized protein K444DRAFT_570555 [Hyaloscypha bicolor E]|uniref:Hypervirulence associated protein TUDOR domain-containing protein n=1 Tax=Hyaloscypha bicolor E TaxID=1095630 RepID=A0A2J6STC2_9HELO|nr:uncharacterized protein K444DRAFT_570555 [Hyaloscypha bicolor E]PMD54028.1 hypothetical protein K444DRAFT_570555 [Hyaloscypha bicolor E]
MSGKVEDKKGNPIEVGDTVFTKIRGGKREGEVDKIVMTEKEAKNEVVKNPPKVLFKDQHGHYVAHNPGTLEVVEGNEGK